MDRIAKVYDKAPSPDWRHLTEKDVINGQMFWESTLKTMGTVLPVCVRGSGCDTTRPRDVTKVPTSVTAGHRMGVFVGLSNMKTALCGCCVALVFCVASLGRSAELPSRNMSVLAVVARGMDGHTSAAGKLQALLEAEAMAQWGGRLVEREELGLALAELGAGLENGGEGVLARFQMGRLLGADFLLHVGIAAETAHVSLIRFPSTDVIYDADLSRRLSLDTIAVRGVTPALRAANWARCDPMNIRVSIGAFIEADSFHRYVSFNDTLHVALRRELSLLERAVIVERFSPSPVLRELELARGGLARPAWAHLSAAPADLLIVGTFEPASKQSLLAQPMTFCFTVRLLSPTGLLAPQEMVFTISGLDAASVVTALVTEVRGAIDRARDAVAKGVPRRHADEEFKHLKQQARLLFPCPSNWQESFYPGGAVTPRRTAEGHAEVVRALRAVENAMLFRGDDPQLLVWAGSLLFAFPGPEDRGRAESQDFHAAALDYIDRAYRLESNTGTRKAFCGAIVAGAKREGGIWTVPRPARSLRMAKHIVQTGASAAWDPHQVAETTRIMVSMGQDLDAKIAAFIPFARSAGSARKRSLYQMFQMLRNINLFLYYHKADAEVQKRAREFADMLLHEDSLCLRAAGRCESLLICKTIDDLSRDYVPHYRSLMGMFRELNLVYGKEFHKCEVTSTIYHGWRDYQRALAKHGLEDDSVELAIEFVRTNLEVGNPRAVGTANRLVNDIVPSLLKDGAYRQACDLLTKVLECPRDCHLGTEVAQLRNRCLEKLTGAPPQALPGMSLLPWHRKRCSPLVCKLLRAEDHIWGLARVRDVETRWEAFSVAVADTAIVPLEGISGRINDIAWSPPFLGVATEADGLYMLDLAAGTRKQLTSSNSLLPANRVAFVAATPGGLYAAIRPKHKSQACVYRVDCSHNELSDTGERVYTHHGGFLRAVGGTPPPVVRLEDWHHRTCRGSDALLEFRTGGRSITVRAIGDKAGQEPLLSCPRGFLPVVRDFAFWQGMLIFATTSGLYVSEPGSNDVVCLVSDVGLSFLSLCATDEQLFVGGSHGVHCVGATDFLAAFHRQASLPRSTRLVPRK